MTNKNLLTIAIPTFNRRKAITEQVKHLLSNDLPKGIEILVIDNASEDGTYDALLNEVIQPSDSQSNIRVLQNSENIGFCGNFFKLFNECNTEYLLINSDEDWVFCKNLKKILSFIIDKKPGFICPQALIDGGIYRGIEKTEPIAFKEHDAASFYISGLVFNREQSLKYLPFVENLSHQNLAAKFYPQVMLAACLSLSVKCYWLNIEICEKKFDLATQIKNEKDGYYHEINSRIKQIKGFLSFFELLGGHPEFIHRAPEINLYKQVILKSTFTTIRSALSIDDKDLLYGFDAGARSYFKMKSRVYRLYLKLYLGLKKKPRNTIRRILKK